MYFLCEATDLWTPEKIWQLFICIEFPVHSRVWHIVAEKKKKVKATSKARTNVQFVSSSNWDAYYISISTFLSTDSESQSYVNQFWEGETLNTGWEMFALFCWE